MKYCIFISLILFNCIGKQRSDSDLTTAKISATSDKNLELLIFDNISASMTNDSREERDIMKSITPGQRALYVTWIVELEVNNGGFNQFYYNSSGQLAHLGEDAFKTFGASKFADLMHRANVTYDSIKGDLEKKYRDRTVESFSASYENNPLNKFDDEFYALYNREPLSELRIRYIRGHVNEFVTP